MTKHSIRPASVLLPGQVAQRFTGGPVLVIRAVDTIPVQYRGGTSSVREITAYNPATRQDVKVLAGLGQNWRVYA